MTCPWSIIPLIDSNSLGKVAWSIRVDSTKHGKLVCDQLDGHNCSKSCHGSIGRNDNWLIIKSISKLGLVGDNNNIRTTCLYLLCSSSHVMSMVVIKNEHDDGSGSLLAILITLNECKWSMLQCSTTVSLGMQVAHLLDLECPLHGHGFTISLSENKAMILAIQTVCNLLALLPVLECHPTADGKSHQTLLQQGCLCTVFCDAVHLVL
mmetsp:Transcript_20743/g.32468  ORF Transcript_20743/g.32468 Transcript_20743/m.32468 type:complete len:208 (-) Transcript_20743:1710-2333(-)